jgi:hypothetical protein
MHDVMHAMGTAHDFDFLFGRWNVHNRRLLRRLAGSAEWEEFPAEHVARPLLDGMGNEDEFRTDHDGGMIGMSFRFFDPKARLWSIYWADSRRCGRLDPPVVGSFADGLGMFEGIDTLAGKPIRVRFVWSQIETPEPRWEQAFSANGGQSWETNWIMEFSAAGEER